MPINNVFSRCTYSTYPRECTQLTTVILYSLQAVLNMPWPHVWSVLFFLMMFTLGMGSQFGGIEAICTSLIDQWPHLRQHHWRVTAGVCLCCFLAGLPMVCNGGVYMFTLMEWHTASWAILLLGLSEVRKPEIQ